MADLLQFRLQICFLFVKYSAPVVLDRINTVYKAAIFMKARILIFSSDLQDQKIHDAVHNIESLRKSLLELQVTKLTMGLFGGCCFYFLTKFDDALYFAIY